MVEFRQGYELLLQGSAGDAEGRLSPQEAPQIIWGHQAAAIASGTRAWLLYVLIGRGFAWSLWFPMFSVVFIVPCLIDLLVVIEPLDELIIQSMNYRANRIIKSSKN